MKNNPIKEKSFIFSLEIIKIYKFLIGEKEYVLSKQLLRSGTSIGANVNEAQAAQSKKQYEPLNREHACFGNVRKPAMSPIARHSQSALALTLRTMQ